MTQYIRLTKKTVSWFTPLLEEEDRLALAHGTAYAIGAVLDKTACGVLVFEMKGEAADIRYIMVAEEYRRRGIGRGMLTYLCRFAEQTVTPVSCTFSAADKSDPLYLLFAEFGSFSVTEEEGFCCRVPFSVIAESDRFAALRGKVGTPQLFFQLPHTQQRSFFSGLQEQGSCFLKDTPPQRFCQPLCLCRTGASGIQAAVFFLYAQNGGADLELGFAWCAQGAQTQLMGLLVTASERLPQNGGWLEISAVNSASMGLVEKLLPEREITERFYRAAWDMRF